MSARPDISDHLAHFTGGASDEDAFGNLCRIIEERRLIGGTRAIRGGYRCVCFTEAPLLSLEGGLVNPTAYSRYRPFGIMFEKRWIFGQGGRPVIYQTGQEYAALPESLRWRHVRYEPNSEPPVDLSWEREWRIRADEVPLDLTRAQIVLPTKDWAERLVAAHNKQQEWRVYEYSMLFDAMFGEAQREPFVWTIFTLR